MDDLDQGRPPDRELRLEPAFGADMEVVLAIGDEALFREFLDGHDDPNRQLNGYRPLLFAVLEHRPEWLPTLLAYGPDLERCAAGQTALSDVIADGSLEIILQLIEAGASLEAVDSDRRTVLERAAFFGRHDVLSRVELSNPDGLLYFAALGGQSEACRVLLARGATVTILDTTVTKRGTGCALSVLLERDGRTSGAIASSLDCLKALVDAAPDRAAVHRGISAACREQDMEALEVLCGLGPIGPWEGLEPAEQVLAPVVKKKQDGVFLLLLEASLLENIPDPLAFVSGCGSDNLTSRLRKRFGNPTRECLLIQSIRDSDLDGVRSHLGAGADANAMCALGPAIYLAVELSAFPPREVRESLAERSRWQARFLDIARLLLEHGAEPTAQDNTGCTALGEACRFKAFALAELLLEHGATCAPAWGGRTPLHDAAKEKSAHAFCKRFIETGVDVDAKNEYGQTALFLAAAKGADENVALLLEAGADPGLEADTGTTPLGIAIRKRRLNIVRLLAPHSDTEHARHGRNAIEQAIDWAGPDILAALLDAGASPWTFRLGRPILYDPTTHRSVFIEHTETRPGIEGLVGSMLRLADDRAALRKLRPETTNDDVDSRAQAKELGERIAETLARIERNLVTITVDERDAHVAMLAAARDGHADVLELMHDAGFPLLPGLITKAACSGQRESLSWLLDAGAPLDQNCCLLREATFSKDPELLGMLRDHPHTKARIAREVRIHGANALILASEHSAAGVVEFLLGEGLHPDALPALGSGPSPLCVAIRRCASSGQRRPKDSTGVDTAMVLIGAGASLGPSGSARTTPLIEAAKRRSAFLVKTLLKKGADTHHTDAEGSTAFDHARKLNARSCLRLLEPVSGKQVSVWAATTPTVEDELVEHDLENMGDLADLQVGHPDLKEPTGVTRSTFDIVFRTVPSWRGHFNHETVAWLPAPFDVAQDLLPEPPCTFLEALRLCNRYSRRDELAPCYLLLRSRDEVVEVIERPWASGYRLLTDARWVAAGISSSEPEWTLDLFGGYSDSFIFDPREPDVIDRSCSAVRTIRRGGARTRGETLARVRVSVYDNEYGSSMGRGMYAGLMWQRRVGALLEDDSRSSKDEATLMLAACYGEYRRAWGAEEAQLELRKSFKMDAVVRAALGYLGDEPIVPWR